MYSVIPHACLIFIFSPGQSFSNSVHISPLIGAAADEALSTALRSNSRTRGSLAMAIMMGGTATRSVIRNYELSAVELPINWFLF